ncbi:MAG: thioesterase family protein [Acidiferrobacteraceae bacterium]
MLVLSKPPDVAYDAKRHRYRGTYEQWQNPTICDLHRVDLFARTGLLRLMIRNRWIPVIAEHTMIYKKPLGLFKRFHVTLKLTHWDAKFFYVKHLFSNREQIITEGASKGAIRSRGGIVNPANIITALQKMRERL